MNLPDELEKSARLMESCDWPHHAALLRKAAGRLREPANLTVADVLRGIESMEVRIDPTDMTCLRSWLEAVSQERAEHPGKEATF